MEAWLTVGKESGEPFEYALVHYNLQESHDVLVILDLLDRIRLGFFHSVFIIPPAASWSRARHADSAGQFPVRTRSQPFGVVHSTPETQARLQHENRSLDFIYWVAEQTLRCEVIRVPLVLIFPEDFGGDKETGPSSLWCMQELRDLEGLHEARRGAGFLCQLAGADQKRPLGIFSNLPSLQQDLQPGWPVFSQNKELLVYKGPLPKTCSCKSAHLPMIGVTADQKFCSSDGLQLGVFFWRRVFSAVKSNSTPIAVTDRERTLTTSAFSSSSSFSVSSASFSWSSLYRAWRSGDLTTSLLREFSRCERVSTYCSLGPQSDLWRFQRSMLLSRCKVSTSVSAPHWSGSSTTTASTRISTGGAPGTELESPRFAGGTIGPWVGTGPGSAGTSTGTSSCSPGPTEGPLTASQSRGGDGNGSSPVVLSGRSQPDGVDRR